MAPITAFVALGSNLGDRHSNIASAIVQLRATASVEVIAISTLFETAAVGGPAGSPPFLNGAAALRTTLPPIHLLHSLQAIESDLGRVRLEHWGPRTLDLDLLLYGDHIIDTEQLTVPHPLMHVRRFVLEPLVEIAGPSLVHPRLGETIGLLLRRLEAVRSDV